MQAYTARKGLARRGTQAEADDREETSAMLKVEVLNSITPPREFEQGALAPGPSRHLSSLRLGSSGRGALVLR